MAKKPTPAPITAAIYARYSSTAQNDASIEQQIKECTEYAQANHLIIVETFEDRAISGKKDNRPGFQKMLRAADRHEFQVLLAYKSNRISRNMRNALCYEERLFQAGVKVIYCKEEFGDNATGRFMLRMMMNMNQFYSENMAEDIRRGLLDSASKGKVLGTIPYGYKKGEDGKYAIDEDAALVVQQIFRDFLNDKSYADIARSLNERGILTKQGKPWGKNSFHAILVNERYTGLYKYAEMQIEDGMPQIIERSVFELAQRKLDSQKQTRARHRDNEDYLLTGKLFCGTCLAPMVGCSGRGRWGHEYFYYSCQTKRVQKSCCRKNVRKEQIEEDVTRAILEAVLQDETIEWIADRIMDIARATNEESQLAYYEKRLGETKRQIANIVHAVEIGLLYEEFKERMEQLQEDKKELTGLIEVEKASTMKVERDEVVGFLIGIREGDPKDKKFQRRIIRDFVRAVYVYDDHYKLFVEFNKSNQPFIIHFKDKTGNDAAAKVVTEGSYKDENGVPLHSYTNPDPRNRIYFTGTGFVITWYFKTDS